VYFTPRDDIKTKLIELIDHETKSIDCAMYMFTEKSIAQSMLEAFLRGVKVRLVLDPISMDVKYGKGLFLKNNGVYVCTYDPSLRNFFEPIMHHKFIIFGFNKLYQKSLVSTGSYNCTASASRTHEENVILIDDVKAIQEYQQCFKLMLARFDISNRFLDEEYKSVEE
jgi:phosphatidylserine/phosphatidylglycerophosphate/cardiolipin synthase-like enzyme